MNYSRITTLVILAVLAAWVRPCPSAATPATSAAPPTPTPTITPVTICPEVDLGSAFPLATSGSTVGHPNRTNPSCALSTAGEVVYQWTAPTAGLFQMDTVGSTFDTVLHVDDGASCFGPALPGGCNDDGGGNRSSLVTVSLHQGQTVLIVVDGYGASSGSYSLHISTAPTPTPTPSITPTALPSQTPTVTPVSICPEVDLGSALPVATSGTTVGHPNRINPSCASSAASEVVYEWTAPAAGLFQIDTIGSTFDTVLHVEDGASCFGPTLPRGCNDDGGGGRSSLVTVALRQGQTVLVVVDGYSSNSGAFSLHITTAPTPTPTPSITSTAIPSPTPTVTPTVVCPEVDLGSTFPVSVSGSTVGHPNRISPSCASSTASEVVYQWTAPTAGLFQMDTIGSTFDTVLHLHDGAACFGATLPGGCNDDGGGNQSSRVTVALRQGQTILIVVDGLGSRSGSYALHIVAAPTPTPTPSVTSTGIPSLTPTVTPTAICPEIDLGSVLPVATSGSTVGHPNRINPSCVPSTAGEVVYEWTAPTAGLFQIDTIGSSFDTVLHVADGASCFGPALPGGCNDDGGGNRSSLVTVSLRQGQIILIIVDGYGASSGAFALHISVAPTPTPTPSVTATAIPSLTPTVTPTAMCPEVDLGSSLPASVSGSTVGHPNRINPSCASSASGEAVYQWTAPAAGLFQIDTIGSTFDTVLHVHDGANCFGPTLPGGCNDDGGGNQSSRLTASLHQGQTILIVVDGIGSRSGSFTLHISVAPTPTSTPSITSTAIPSPTPTETPIAICPEVDLGSALPVALSGSTVGHPHRLKPSCAPSVAGEAVYQWTAPAAGLFQIDTVGSSFDTVLHVHDGATCFGTTLPGGCNDDGGGNRSSLVTASLHQGQTILIVVDGYGASNGSFNLHISVAPTPTPTPSLTSTAIPSPTPTVTPTAICPEVDLGSALPVSLSGSTIGHPNRIDPSCASSSAGDAVYQWTAPTAGPFRIDTIGSTFDTVLHVHDGATCFGSLLPGACNDDGGGNRSSRVTVSLRQGQTVMVVVDGLGLRTGFFTLHISAAPTPTPTRSATSTATASPTPTATSIAICPEVDLGSTLPVAVSGSTVGHPNRLKPPCAVSTANDVVYQWTAPSAGLFQIDTIGSTFDTVVHVHNGASCFGPVLPGGCNDDGGGNLSSLVTVSLLQGQTIEIVVDGYRSNSGFFTLHISAATPSALNRPGTLIPQFSREAHHANDIA